MSVTTGGVLVDAPVAAIAAVADKPASREWSGRKILGCVLIKGGSAYAADGFRALRVDLHRESVTADRPLAIKAEALVSAVKSIGRNRSGPGRFVEVLEADDGLKLSANGNTFRVDAMDGTYPDVDALMPQSAPKATVTFNAALMAGVLTAMSKAGVDNDAVTLRLHGSGDDERIVLEGWLPDDDGGHTRSITGIVMPMVTKGGAR